MSQTVWTVQMLPELEYDILFAYDGPDAPGQYDVYLRTELISSHENLDDAIITCREHYKASK
jgi:hypothetical protein